jgi:hypothetical protein
MAQDLPAWMEKHIVSGESCLMTKYAFFEEIHRQTPHGRQPTGNWVDVFVRHYPSPFTTFPTYLTGTILEGEWQSFEKHCSYYDKRLAARAAVIGGLFYDGR